MAMKSFRSDLVQFSNDERFVFKQITNEVQIFSSQSLLFQDHTAIVARVQLKGFSQYKVAPVTSGESLSIAFFFPESGGNPGRVSIVAVNLNNFEVSEPMGSRSIFGASDATLMWNATATALLIFSRSNLDTSGASYTGAAAVYFMSANGEDSGKVEQTKDGPVHDVQWSPDGEKFVMIAGKMPAQVTLFNAKAEPIYQFGASPRNTVVWSPHGRFLCIAGFGNLAGEMDFYDVLRLKKIGSNASDCSIRFGWSPDSRYFLTASLAPRMNVDNNMKIFRYNGDGPLLRMDFDRAYEATWMPLTAGVFPNRGPSPGRSQVSQMEREQRQKAAAEKAAAKPAAYRPPRSTGTVASMLTRDTSSAPVGKVKSTAAPTASSSSFSTGKFVPSAKSRSIPGMGAKPAATPATTSTSSTKPQQQQSQQKSGNGTNNGAITGRGNAPPVAAAVAAPVESAANREKRAKALQKKLKQIEEIKTRIAAGQAVDAEQRKKVESEASLREELRSLNA
jgi:translation initiation factor 2A